jgi:hypothetical protein
MIVKQTYGKVFTVELNVPQDMSVEEIERKLRVEAEKYTLGWDIEPLQSMCSPFTMLDGSSVPHFLK